MNVRSALETIGGAPLKDAYRKLLEEMRVTGNVVQAQQHLQGFADEMLYQAGNNPNLSQSVQQEATLMIEEARQKPLSLLERLSLEREHTPGNKR